MSFYCESQRTLCKQTPSDIPQQLFLWLYAFLFFHVCTVCRPSRRQSCCSLEHPQPWPARAVTCLLTVAPVLHQCSGDSGRAAGLLGAALLSIDLVLKQVEAHHFHQISPAWIWSSWSVLSPDQGRSFCASLPPAQRVFLDLGYKRFFTSSLFPDVVT